MILGCAALLTVVLVAGCGKHAAATRSSVEVHAAGQPIVVTEDDLEKYVRWSRDFAVQANKNIVEMRAMTDRSGVSQSEVVSMVERQRRESAEIMSREPATGVKSNALGAAIAGVVSIDFQGDKVEYRFGHDEVALASARQKYGDQFVDWVVAREDKIRKILSE